MPQTPTDIIQVTSPGILPQWVARSSVAIPPGAVPDDAARLPPGLEKAVATRRVQYLAGRRCAANALDDLIRRGVWAGMAVVGRREGGIPEWPEGACGSITHTRTFASAAAAPLDLALSVGIDTEQLIEPERAAALGPSLLTPGEGDRAQAFEEGHAIWTTVAFSLKESLFKLLFPVVRRHFYYSAASMTDLDLRAGRARIRLEATLTSAYAAGLAFEGRVAFEDGLVHTGLWLTPDGAPGS